MGLLLRKFVIYGVPILLYASAQRVLVREGPTHSKIAAANPGFGMPGPGPPGGPFEALLRLPDLF